MMHVLKKLSESFCGGVVKRERSLRDSYARYSAFHSVSPDRLRRCSPASKSKMAARRKQAACYCIIRAKKRDFSAFCSLRRQTLCCLKSIDYFFLLNFAPTRSIEAPSVYADMFFPFGLMHV